MKAGLVQMFHALSVLDDTDGLTVLVNGDEEVGSPTSSGLIEEAARQSSAALVLEMAADDGALKTARRASHCTRCGFPAGPRTLGWSPSAGSTRASRQRT